MELLASEIQEILEKMVEDKQRKLNKVGEKFVLDKFSGKSANARRWIETFEKECERFEVTKDGEKIEILGFFLEKTSSDWYKNGTLLDYALKKERLFLKVRKCTLIDQIALGLPSFVLNRIERGTLKTTEDLSREIGNLEHSIHEKNSGKKNETTDNSDKVEKKKPCRICEKKGEGLRYHPESLCWFEIRETERDEREVVECVNHSELEVDLNDEDPRN
ncbi:hypothetical protein QAD02_003036 [Eretmocerus hayati]|uniref:Uncharacterized protein n=1 Tax=Eretmocerus hayati TaxID=131215 RepID=A0ACC2NL00_9HYME|nr:hypothetical protein QAD02_003036 [Eretmocerus hayati]